MKFAGISSIDPIQAPPAPEERPTVDVCVCTFHRPMVVETLRSIAAQSRAPDRIIVIDNAEEPEAAGRIDEAAGWLGLPVLYVHAPARNISVARNAGLSAARADWVAFIDDDERAHPHWLQALVSTAQDGGYDAILGPVDAVYAKEAPSWMRAIGAHSTRPVIEGGQIYKGYAGNVLLRRAKIETLGLRFDPALGQTGGEDDTFFLGLTGGGGRIGFAADALVLESVPPGRTKLAWLLRRNFRNGQTHGDRLLLRRGPLARVAQMIVAAAKAATCLGGAAFATGGPGRRGQWLLRAAMHTGAIARLAGLHPLKLY